MSYPIHVSAVAAPNNSEMVDEVAQALHDVIMEVDDDPDEDPVAVFRRFAASLIRRLEPSGIVLVRVTTTKETVQ